MKIPTAALLMVGLLWHPLRAYAHRPYCFGVGSRLSWRIEGSYYETTPQLLKQLHFSPNNRFLGVWLNSRWRRHWLAPLPAVLRKKYIPVLFYYFLGNLYAHEPHAWAYVQDQRAAWRANAHKLAAILKPLNGTVLVVVQPEFNVRGIQGHPSFGRALADIARIIKKARHPGLRLLVGAGVGDFGRYGDHISDRAAWRRFSPSLNAALPALDFIGFQEMRAATHADTKGQMRVYSPRKEGLFVLPQRTLSFARYLYLHYHRPLLLGYVMISSFRPPGDTAPWGQLAAKAYAGILQETPALENSHVFGTLAMSLFSDKAHNNNNQEFFGNAADYFGLINSRAPLGQPQIGPPPYRWTAAGRVWYHLTKNWSTETHRPYSPVPCYVPTPGS